MKTPIGVALIFAGTALVLAPFAYYLAHLSIETEVVTRMSGGGRAISINYGPVFQLWQALLGILGLVMIAGGVLGTLDKKPSFSRKSKSKASPAASASVESAEG